MPERRSSSDDLGAYESVGFGEQMMPIARFFRYGHYRAPVAAGLPVTLQRLIVLDNLHKYAADHNSERKDS